MAFGSSIQQTPQASSQGEAQDPIYLKLAAGERVVRILDKEEQVFYRYFMPVNVGNGKRDGRSIVVGYGDTPIKRHMAEIGEGDKEFRKVQKRMLLNVLDRTLVKKTETGVVYPNEDGVFPESVRGLPSEPNNKVMVIEFGSTLMKSILINHNRIHHSKTFEPLPVWAFDLRIITAVNPRDRLDVTRQAVAGMDQDPLPAELAALPKYDLASLVRPLPNEAQERLLAGEEYMEVIRSLGWERPVPTLPQ